LKKITLLLVVVLFSFLAFGQDAPKVEVFGGYQFTSVDTNGGDRQNLNGWNADVAFHVTENVSVVGDVSGAYKSEGVDIPGLGSISAKLRLYNFLFGPRASFGTGKVKPFAEALFGVGRVSVGGSVSGIGDASEARNGFAMALGGGVDIEANEHFAVRAAKFDYLMNRFSIDEAGVSLSETLNNYRFATGVVFKF